MPTSPPHLTPCKETTELCWTWAFLKTSAVIMGMNAFIRPDGWGRLVFEFALVGAGVTLLGQPVAKAFCRLLDRYLRLPQP